MKLRPAQTYPPALLKGRVLGELNIALSAYAAYYRETTGQTIELWPSSCRSSSSFWTRIGTSKRGGGGPRTGPAEDRRRASGRTWGERAGGRG
jgi:hypothetical protein